MNIKIETNKIINLLKNEQINWGGEYSGEGYTISIPPFDDNEFLEDNLMNATLDIMWQLSQLRRSLGGKKSSDNLTAEGLPVTEKLEQVLRNRN